MNLDSLFDDLAGEPLEGDIHGQERRLGDGLGDNLIDDTFKRLRLKARALEDVEAVGLDGAKGLLELAVKRKIVPISFYSSR